MEEIKVGEYVRTKNGYIAKIIKIDEQFIWCDDVVKGYDSELIQISGDNEYEDTYKDIIKKHSPNLIDLIEVGDVVQILGYNWIFNLFDKDVLDNFIADYKENNWKLDFIITKEQIESIKYKVEE